MAKWATIKEVAIHIKVSERAIRDHIQRRTKLGALFKKGGPKIVADLQEIDELIRGSL